MKIYLAGPMTGIPFFNYPTFMAGHSYLNTLGYEEIFNPAEADIRRCGHNFFPFCPNGSKEEGKIAGFSLREALAEDMEFICKEAHAIAMLPGWESSAGANAEWHLARALGHNISYLRREDYLPFYNPYLESCYVP